MPGSPSSPRARMSPNAATPATRSAAAPASSRRRCRRATDGATTAPGGSGGAGAGSGCEREVERRVLLQDPLVQAAQLRARLDADLLDQRGARPLIGGERLRLAA